MNKLMAGMVCIGIGMSCSVFAENTVTTQLTPDGTGLEQTIVTKKVVTRESLLMQSSRINSQITASRAQLKRLTDQLKEVNDQLALIPEPVVEEEGQTP